MAGVGELARSAGSGSLLQEGEQSAEKNGDKNQSEHRRDEHRRDAYPLREGLGWRVCMIEGVGDRQAKGHYVGAVHVGQSDMLGLRDLDVGGPVFGVRVPKINP